MQGPAAKRTRSDDVMVASQQTTGGRTSPSYAEKAQVPPHSQNPPRPRAGPTSEQRAPPPTPQRSSTGTTRVSQDLIFKLSNVPAAFCNQRAIHRELKTASFFPAVNGIRFIFPNSATISFTEPPPEKAQKFFQNRMGDPGVTFMRLGRAGKQPQLPPRPPTYSCVVTRVPMDILEEDVREALTNVDVPFRKCWRIISRATNRETSLFRVVSDDPEAIDFLLNRGLEIFLNRHRCEPSNAPPPRPLQCSRCFNFGHSAAECRKTPICPFCGLAGCRQDCNTQSPRCPNCTGDHPAFAAKCPRKSAPLEPLQKAAPIKPADKPVSPLPAEATAKDFNASFIRVEDFVRCLSLVLLNLFPDRRAEVQSAVEVAVKACLGRDIRHNYAGHLLHISV